MKKREVKRPVQQVQKRGISQFFLRWIVPDEQRLLLWRPVVIFDEDGETN